MQFDDLHDRRVVIWGVGREGHAAYDELARRGIRAEFAVTGGAGVPDDVASLSVTGDAAVQRLLAADVVIKSPGIPHTAPEYVEVRRRGVVITSLTDLWLAGNHQRTIGVTGTKGKSTTSALIQHLFIALGVPASLVGNGGTPVTDCDTDEAGVAVCEISSYQAAELTSSPRAVVVTSLFPEHLTWHGGLDEYVADKLNVAAHGPESVIVPEVGGPIAALVSARVDSETTVIDPDRFGIGVSDDRLQWRGVGEVRADQLRIVGRHNLGNAALALAAVLATHEVPAEQRRTLLEALESFAPLEHRLQIVPSNDGRRWVDDSLATAPEAVVAALETFADSSVVLIFGGADRGLAFDHLSAYLEGRAANAPVRIVAVGPAGVRWAGSGRADTTVASDFADAMRIVRREQSESDVVLLSPGAPSFDEFTDYQARSEAFRAASEGA